MRFADSSESLSSRGGASEPRWGDVTAGFWRAGMGTATTRSMLLRGTDDEWRGGDDVGVDVILVVVVVAIIEVGRCKATLR